MGPVLLIFTNEKTGLDQTFNTNILHLFIRYLSILEYFQIYKNLQKFAKWYKKYLYTPYPVSSTLFYFFNFLFIFGCRVIIAAQAFLWFWRVRATLQLPCEGFYLLWLLLLQRTGFRRCRLQQLRHVGPAYAAAGLQSTG